MPFICPKSAPQIQPMRSLYIERKILGVDLIIFAARYDRIEGGIEGLTQILVFLAHGNPRPLAEELVVLDIDACKVTASPGPGVGQPVENCQLVLRNDIDGTFGQPL